MDSEDWDKLADLFVRLAEAPGSYRDKLDRVYIEMAKRWAILEANEVLGWIYRESEGGS